MNAYLKTVIAVIIPTLGSLLTALGTVYGHAWWYPVLGIATTSAITAFGVYITPNIQPVEPLSPEDEQIARLLARETAAEIAKLPGYQLWPAGKETTP